MKSDIKNVTWKDIIVLKSELSYWLTKRNFQPGKFIVLETSSAFSKDSVMIVYVDKEEEIKDAAQ